MEDGLRHSWRLVPLVVLTVTILAFGIASPVPARAANVAVVELLDDTFNPETVRVDPGDRVMWVNLGRNPHNVLASDGSWGSRILQPGDSFSVVFPVDVVMSSGNP